MVAAWGGWSDLYFAAWPFLLISQEIPHSFSDWKTSLFFPCWLVLWSSDFYWIRWLMSFYECLSLILSFWWVYFFYWWRLVPISFWLQLIGWFLWLQQNFLTIFWLTQLTQMKDSLFVHVDAGPTGLGLSSFSGELSFVLVFFFVVFGRWFFWMERMVLLKRRKLGVMFLWWLGLESFVENMAQTVFLTIIVIIIYKVQSEGMCYMG